MRCKGLSSGTVYTEFSEILVSRVLSWIKNSENKKIQKIQKIISAIFSHLYTLILHLIQCLGMEMSIYPFSDGVLQETTMNIHFHRKSREDEELATSHDYELGRMDSVIYWSLLNPFLFSRCETSDTPLKICLPAWHLSPPEQKLPLEIPSASTMQIQLYLSMNQTCRLRDMYTVVHW